MFSRVFPFWSPRSAILVPRVASRGHLGSQSRPFRDPGSLKCDLRAAKVCPLGAQGRSKAPLERHLGASWLLLGVPRRRPGATLGTMSPKSADYAPTFDTTQESSRKRNKILALLEQAWLEATSRPFGSSKLDSRQLLEAAKTSRTLETTRLAAEVEKAVFVPGHLARETSRTLATRSL